MPIQPTISIVIPTFNCSKVLAACLESVISQTYSSKEIIIIDGNSTDTTLQVIQHYKDYITYWVSEPDKGIYDAMNKGIAAANGEWLYFIGSDDTFFNTTVLEEVFADETWVDNDVIYGNVLLKQSGDLYDGSFDNNKLFDKNICHQAIFVQKSVFEKIGVFNTKYKIWADYELNIRWFNNPHIKHSYIEKTICLYNDNGFSTLYADKDFLLAKDQLFSQHNYVLTVSVIIPIHRYINLSECLNRLLLQSYPHLDIILVGHSLSTYENYMHFVKGFSSRNKEIRFVALEQKNTLIDHLKEGINAAKGQYIWIMGPKYMADEHTLHTLLSFFKSGTMAELLYCLPANIVLTPSMQSLMHSSKRNQQQAFIDNDKETDLVVSILRNGLDLKDVSATFFRKAAYTKIGCSDLVLQQEYEGLVWSYLLLIADVIYVNKLDDRQSQQAVEEPRISLNQGAFLQQLGVMINQCNSLSAKFRNRSFVILTYWWVKSFMKGGISLQRSKDIYKVLNRMGNYLNKLIIKFAIK